MAIRRSMGERVFTVFNYTILFLLMVVTLYPFLYVIFASFSKSSLLMAHSGILLHSLGFDLGAYKLVLRNPMIGLSYLNTLFIVVVGTALNVIMTALAAYVLSRKSFYWKRILMFIIVFTMMFSGGLIPFYLVVRDLGLADTRMALILPTLISTYNLIIMRTSFAAIPVSLEESAKMDGATDFTVLFKIIIPLSMPVIAVMILFYGVGNWNSWFNAMIFLKTREKYPLQLILREIILSSNTDSMTTDVSSADKELVTETVKYATIMVASLPIMCVYPFLQKYFVKGVMVGSLKE
ncbi:MAG: carbohydrate ABC transporter permease [Provencibacterium sp.]|jgi:putative aldouronate transport system permease protein|nr:carbohydrate ABC transporter permease [Provencibacterium sp.]